MNNVTATVLDSTNLTSSEPGVYDQAVIFCGFMIPFLIIGVIGHVLVLLSVLYHEDLHRPLNVMIVNLSVSQFFMLMIAVFGNVIVMLTNENEKDFILENREVLPFFTLLFSTSTSVFYGLIALNRLVSTVFETLYNRLAPWKLVWILVAAGWAWSLVASILPWITNGQVEFSVDTYFFLGVPWFHAGSTAKNTGIFWFLTFTFFIFPAISAIFCYSYILIYTSRAQRRSGLPVNSPRAINLRDRARVVLMLLTATGVYLICFYMTFIFWSQNGRSRTGQYFFLWLVFVPNALNPAIYGLITPQFRDAYVRIFLWLLRRWSCRRPYGDSRRVFPAGASGDAVGGPPSVMFQSAKNSIVFPNNLNNHLNELGAGEMPSRSQLPTSARNLELKVKDLHSRSNMSND